MTFSPFDKIVIVSIISEKHSYVLKRDMPSLKVESSCLTIK